MKPRGATVRFVVMINGGNPANALGVKTGDPILLSK